MTMRTSFRWEFRSPTLTHRSYAEAELQTRGRRPADDRWYVDVYLIRDDMAHDHAALLDPERREGMRVYVGACQDEDACRTLAFLAPVEGMRHAYTLIHRVLRANPYKVARFGDEWLTEAFRDRAVAP